MILTLHGQCRSFLLTVGKGAKMIHNQVVSANMLLCLIAKQSD